MFKVLEKAFFPLLFALFIDGFQAFLSAGLGGLGLITGVGAPIGFVLGFVVNMCISLTFGIGLIALLGTEGMFYPYVIAAALFGEVIPIFDNLPLWTGLVLMCAFKKLKEEPGAGGAVAVAAGAILTPSPSAFVGAARAMDGIRRPANDNEPYAEAA
jgi:hypothetical protein